jgi:hypothetical protein
MFESVSGTVFAHCGRGGSWQAAGRGGSPSPDVVADEHATSTDATANRPIGIMHRIMVYLHWFAFWCLVIGSQWLFRL